MNCAIQIAVRDNRIIGTLPPGDPHQSGGELCVKGRFCLGEWANHPQRLGEPQYHFPEGMGIISWDEAIEKAGVILQGNSIRQSGRFFVCGPDPGRDRRGQTILSACLPHSPLLLFGVE